MTDNYETPSWLKDIFGSWFDPCPLDPNPQTNGLMISWKEKNYVNPPYSDPLPWVEKAIEEQKKGKSTVLLLKLDCSTKWYRLLHEAGAHVLLINERVKFNGKAPPFSNALFFLEGL